LSQISEKKNAKNLFFFVVSVGLVEVTNIGATISSSMAAVVAPGAIGLQIVPSGSLSLNVSITQSDSWGTQTPQFDVIYMSDAQWMQFKDPQGNPGQVGVLTRSATTYSVSNSFWSQPTPQWIVLDNTAGLGVSPPPFSSLTLAWSVSFAPIRTNSPSSTPAGCTAGMLSCQCRPVGTACDASLQCVSGRCQAAAPATTGGQQQTTAPSQTGQQTNPTGQQTSPTGQPTVQSLSTTTSGQLQPPTTTQILPNGQIDCSDAAVFPQCLNAIYCQPGQTRMCVCDANGNVINKACQGFATVATQPTTRFQGAVTTTGAQGGSCLSQCSSACGDKSVKTCMCNGAAVMSFECGDAASASQLLLAMHAVLIAAAIATSMH
jgi:hypothetical protein